MLLDFRNGQVTGPPFRKTGPQLIITIPSTPQPTMPQQTRRPSFPFPLSRKKKKVEPPFLSSKAFHTAKQGIADFLAGYTKLQFASGQYHIDKGLISLHIGGRGKPTHFQSTFTIQDLPDEEAVDKVQQFIEQQHGEGLAIPKEMAVNIVADKPNKKVTLTISAFIK